MRPYRDILRKTKVLEKAVKILNLEKVSIF